MMRILCIKKFFPDDGWGNGPNEFSFAFTENHSYYAEIINDWEEGTSVDSNDFAVNDEIYNFCINEVENYILSEDTESECDEEELYSFLAGIYNISEEDFAKLKIEKESVLTDLVENSIFGCYNVSDNKKISYCLMYLVSDFNNPIAFSDDHISKDILRDKIEKYRK